MARRRVAVVLLGGLLAMVAIACAKEIEKPNGYAVVNTPTPPNPGADTEGGFPDSSTKKDSGLDSGDGGVCNDLVPAGSGVDEIAIAADPPASTGGTVVDGTYDLKDYVIYVGISGVVAPLGISARMTIRIAGTGKTIDKVSEVTNAGVTPTPALTSSTYSTVGSAFATTEVCPGTSSKTWQFTSNSLNQIVLTDPSTREAFTFLKRP
ncbi:MAG TPA: hypothetical protein VLT33_01525 [Labilithrix sp.]|nr:hypothetical protein [Labilithrix sp.]